MKEEKPLVSILLPVYKSEKYLEESIKSLLSQSYKNIEIVAVADYLKDDSLKILRQFRKKDKRLRIYKNVQTYGLAVTLNRAVKKTNGDFIAFMDTHGTSTRQRIAKQVSFLQKNPKIAAVGTQTIILNEDGKRVEKSNFPLEHESIYKRIIDSSSLKFETVMISKKALPKDILKFTKDKYPYLYADVFLKIAMYKEIANLNFYLNTTRINTKNKAFIRMDKSLSLLKLLLKSSTQYDYKPSLRSLFVPIIKQI